MVQIIIDYIELSDSLLYKGAVRYIDARVYRNISNSDARSENRYHRLICRCKYDYVCSVLGIGTTKLRFIIVSIQKILLITRETRWSGYISACCKIALARDLPAYRVIRDALFWFSNIAQEFLSCPSDIRVNAIFIRTLQEPGPVFNINSSPNDAHYFPYKKTTAVIPALNARRNRHAVSDIKRGRVIACRYHYYPSYLRAIFANGLQKKMGAENNGRKREGGETYTRREDGYMEKKTSIYTLVNSATASDG